MGRLGISEATSGPMTINLTRPEACEQKKKKKTKFTAVGEGG